MPIVDLAHFAALGPLMGTLTPEGFKSAYQAQQDQQLEQIHQSALAAAQQSQQASQQYQNLAAAPPPQVGGGNFANELLGGVASVLSQNPAYLQGAQQQRQGLQSDLMESRKSNLMALRDLAGQRADVAEKMGNLEVAEKARLTSERLARQIGEMDAARAREQALQDIDAERKFKAGESDLERKNRLEIARIAASSREGSGTNAEVDPTNIPVIARMVAANQARITDFPQKSRDKIAKWVSDHQIDLLPPKARDTVNTLNAATGIIKRVKNLSAELNTFSMKDKSGKTKGISGSFERLREGAVKKVGGLTQTNERAAIFNATREGFLATMARAAGERGTLTDQDIARARSLFPSLLDSKEVAADKITQLEDFVKELRNRAIQTYSTILPEQMQGGAQVPGAAADSGPPDLIWNPDTQSLEPPN